MWLITARRAVPVAVAIAALALSGCGGRDGDADASGAAASPGITETSVKLGGSFPFSGAGASYIALPNAMKAHFAAVNDAGGVNGRKIEFLTEDDAYDPTKAVQATRKLVEQSEVFAIFGSNGSTTNLATMPYLNRKQVPQALVTTGAPAFSDDIEKNPWTINFPPDYGTEGKVYAEYIKAEKPQAKIAVLYQNDDLGKQLLNGLEVALEGSDAKVAAKESFELTDASVATQTTKLARSRADVFVFFTTPKAAAQALATADKLGWKPLRILNTSSASVDAVLKPFGLGKARGIIGATYLKDPTDPQFADDPGVKEYLAAMKAHAPRDNPNDLIAEIGYANAQTMVAALEQMKEPTRESLMASLRSLDVAPSLLLPGIRVQTSATDGRAIQALQIQEFDGKRWVLQGEPISTDQ